MEPGVWPWPLFCVRRAVAWAINHSGLGRLLVSRVAASAGRAVDVRCGYYAAGAPERGLSRSAQMVQVRGKGGDVFLPGWCYSLLVGIG